MAALLGASLIFTGCGKTPVPPEVDQAPLLVEELRGAGAPAFLPDDFKRLVQSVADAELHLGLEKQRFFLFRDLEKPYTEYKSAVAFAGEVKTRLTNAKNNRAASLKASIESTRTQINILKSLTGLMNEGRLARRSVTKAEIHLCDAEDLLKKGNFDAADIKLANADIQYRSAEKTLSKAVGRYLDPSQVERWRRSAEAAVAESARTGGVAVVVLKLDRKMLVYKSGKLVQTYPIGIGKNGLSDKLYSGDTATPEGRYLVTKKNPRSKYYKALMINYPNQEDRERFAWAKKRGLIPRGRGIGNNVEIHGNGPDSVTEGCVSVDNQSMDRIFNMIGVNTPVVIVGTIKMNEMLTAVCRTGGS